MHDSTRSALLDAVARAVVEENRDTVGALHRAAQTLGLRMPIKGLTQASLYHAIDTYRQLFHPTQQLQIVKGRRLALEAMRALSSFSPRLFGGLVHGGDRIDHIHLLLKADTPEDVLLKLDDLGIPWQSAESTLDYGRGRNRAVPGARFVAGETVVRLFILPARSRERPLDVIDGHPLQTLSEQALQRLIENPIA